MLAISSLARCGGIYKTLCRRVRQDKFLTMSISRLLNEVRPLFQLLEEPLTRSPAFYARPQRMLLGDPFRSPFGGLGTLGGRPAVDVIEEGDKYVVAADLPGVKKEDVEVRVAEDGRSITIEGRMVEVPSEDQRQQQGERRNLSRKQHVD